jgi:hypothetical protein
MFLTKNASSFRTSVHEIRHLERVYFPNNFDLILAHMSCRSNEYIPFTSVFAFPVLNRDFSRVNIYE